MAVTRSGATIMTSLALATCSRGDAKTVNNDNRGIPVAPPLSTMRVVEIIIDVGLRVSLSLHIKS